MRFLPRLNRKQAGQSFVELSVILIVILTLLVGMVEVANLLNEYINLADGVREAARFGSNDDPFIREATADCPTPFCVRLDFFLNIDIILEGQEDGSGTKISQGSITPLVLNPANGDDVVISFWGIDESGNAVRFPDSDGWSKNAYTGEGTPKASQKTTAQIQSLLDPSAPATGIVLVEVFYHYEQILKLPLFFPFPDPMPVYAYAIMPLSAAEPTPTPIP